MNRGTWRALALRTMLALGAALAPRSAPAAPVAPTAAKTAAKPSASHLTASAALYAAGALEDAGDYEALDRLAALAATGKLAVDGPLCARLAAYAAPREAWLPAAVRRDVTRFEREPTASVFDAIVSSSIEQMRAYADLVRSVADSVDRFRDENVADAGSGGYLADLFPAESSAGSFTLLTDGAALEAAPLLERQTRELAALLGDAALQHALGATSRAELVAKTLARPVAEVASAERRAEAGAALLAGLAAAAPLLEAHAAPARVARRLAPLGPAARAWLAVAPPPSKAAIVSHRPRCFDGQRKLAPCAAPRGR